MQRECVCGTAIAINSQLCAECRKKYGAKSSSWPVWLREWMQDYQKELDQEYLHQHLELIDEETFTAEDSSAGGNSKWVYLEYPEPEFDEWGNEYAVIDGFKYIDVDVIDSQEKSFERRLRYLSNLPPKEKARLRKQWGME